VQLLGYATLAAHKLDARENTVDAIGFHLQSVSYLLDFKMQPGCDNNVAFGESTSAIKRMIESLLCKSTWRSKDRVSSRSQPVLLPHEFSFS
jgi:hypothetical protein